VLAQRVLGEASAACLGTLPKGACVCVCVSAFSHESDLIWHMSRSHTEDVKTRGPLGTSTPCYSSSDTATSRYSSSDTATSLRGEGSPEKAETIGKLFKSFLSAGPWRQFVSALLTRRVTRRVRGV
jgi:hypothetical protein